MKKLILVITAIVASVAMVSAAEKVTRDVKVLPAEARRTLASAFSKVNVNHIKIDSNLFGKKEYDVILDDGTEIEFDGDGKIKEVEAGNKGVPTSLVIKPIRDYISKNYPGQKLIKLDIGTSDYEIELFNGIDLRFDRSGKFLKVDR